MRATRRREGLLPETPEVKKPDPRARLALFFKAGFKSNGTAWERRLYKRLWAAVQRLEAGVRREQAARSREFHRLHTEQIARTRARWYRKNRRRQALYNARYHREHRARRCSFCGGSPGFGRYCLRPARDGLACKRCFA
jgi:hypothetical protein